MSKLSESIIASIGGVSNIQKLENCMTRVRIVPADESLVVMDDIKQIDGVMGVMKAGEQYQIIVGPGTASKIKDEIQAVLDTNKTNQVMSDTKNQMKDKFSLGGKANSFLKNIANIFIPLIPGMIGCGLILGISTVLKNSSLYADYQSIIDLLAIFGGAVFFVMMIVVGITTAQVYGGSMIIGAIMAGILTHPGLANISLFGENLVPSRGGIIAVILVVAFAAFLEKRLKKVLSGTFDLILNPILVILISGTVAILVLQPIGGWLADGITKIAVASIEHGGALTGFILAGTFLPIVMTGLHQGLTPIHLQLITEYGMTTLLPILAMAGAGQVGASAAVLLKTKSKRLKKVIKSALPVGILGIGEPLIYGVTLPLGKPFITACIGGAFGGAVIAFFKVGAISIGISGITLLIAIAENKYLPYLLGLLTAYAAGFIVTYLVGFKDLED
ncbi:MAG: PTS transporter subunit EIIC [Alphaproteobacteria bacterium]|jgi:PTS system sucrose-specific IIC component|nr:PTS transporter subunit EIIC [Alphaproteobacteria bacterium]